MESLGTIIKSWALYVEGSDFTKKLIKKRATICGTCPFLTTILGFAQCSKCGCPISAKTANPELECPEKKWTKEITSFW